MLTPDKIAELKAKHGPDLNLHEVEGLQLVTRPVDMKAWRAFRKRVLTPLEAPQAGEELLFEVLVYPEAPAVRAYLERKPLAIGGLCDEVCKEAGALSSWVLVSGDGEGNEQLTNGGLRVTLRPIAGAVGRLYQQRLDDPKLAPGATEWLLQQAVAAPEWSELEAAVGGRPFVLDRLGTLVAERAGRSVEIRTKKL